MGLAKPLTVNRNTGLMPPSTSSACRDAQIAQSVEQRIENPRVRGSIPRLGTIILKSSFRAAFFMPVRKVRKSVFLRLSHTIILKTSYLYGVFLYL
jgi:hypothetical protein